MSKKSAPLIQDSEAQFQIEELFFSTTDKHGLILSFNDVFVRVSEYSRDELKGAPHNLVRHPDMPKAVFRLLWETIEKGEPIVAYVKNRNKSGRYYWVLAMVFPSLDGYLSIRLKPSSEIKETVAALYRETRAKESSGGIEAGTATLLEGIRSLGFSDYRAFMRAALISEILSRDRAIRSNQNKAAAERPLTRSRNGYGLKYTKAATEASHLFDAVNAIADSTAPFSKQVEQIRHAKAEISVLTMNMVIAASKLGSAGELFSVVSDRFTQMMTEITSAIESFSREIASFSESLTYSHFLIGVSKFQIEMVLNLAGEYDERDLEILKSQMDANLVLVEKHFLEFGSLFQRLSRTLAHLFTIVNAMDIVSVAGKIEMARMEAASKSLASYAGRMTEITKEIKEGLVQIDDQTNMGIDQYRQAASRLRDLQLGLSDD